MAGANAVCTRLDTGATLPVTNAASGPGFTVAANATYPVSCTIYNVAPQPPASIVVSKRWNVNGVLYANGAQPPELTASLTLSGTSQQWDDPRTGLNAGAVVPINETTSVASSSLCTITSQRLTSQNGSTVDLALPYSATLAAGANTYQITNTVTCPARLTLVKTVLNGDAVADRVDPHRDRAGGSPGGADGHDRRHRAGDATSHVRAGRVGWRRRATSSSPTRTRCRSPVRR